MKPKLKTVYVLRMRYSDDQPWSDPDYYRKRADRDHDERINRIIGGMRCHSYDEKRTPEEIEELCD